MHSNGYEAKRRRRKYVCRQACRRKPRREGEAVHPVVVCPYLEDDRVVGYVVNVGRTLPDGSIRLAREVPHGSPAWNARYGRRNNASPIPLALLPSTPPAAPSCHPLRTRPRPRRSSRQQSPSTPRPPALAHLYPQPPVSSSATPPLLAPPPSRPAAQAQSVECLTPSPTRAILPVTGWRRMLSA